MSGPSARRGATLVLLAAAGCGSGAYIEVHTGTLDVAEVELVTGIGACTLLDGTPCKSIIGDPGVGFPPREQGELGDLYMRGPSGVARVSAGVATFELDPASPVEVAFAIGRDPGGKVVGVAVVDHTIDDTSGPIVYRVDLDPAQNLFGQPRDATKAAITEWGSDTFGHCVGIAPIQPTPRTPLFILPRGNPDCDELADDPTECNQVWFDGLQVDSNASACVTPSTRIAQNPCVLGIRATCIDHAPGDPSPPPSCIETFSCLPDAVCEGCSDVDESCQQATLTTAVAPRATCIAPGMGIGGDSAECQTPVPNTFSLANAIVDPIIKVEILQTPPIGMPMPYHEQRSDHLKQGELQFTVSHSGDTIVVDRIGTGPLTTRIDTILIVTTKAAGAVEHETWIPLTLKLSTADCGTPPPVPCVFDGSADTEFACGGGGGG